MSRPFFLLLFLPAIGCSSEPSAPALSDPVTPQFTPGSGVGRDELAKGTFDVGKVKRITGDWELELEAMSGMELAVREHTYATNSHTGWHKHPGPVFIQVVQGTVTFYEADDPSCTPIVVGAGGTYLDLGEHGHIGRNESSTVVAVDVTVLFGPPGTTTAGFRIDLSPAPGNCPF